MTDTSSFALGGLMDLAVLDTSDMQAQTSRLPKQGIYILNVDSAGLTEQPPADPANPMSYNLGIKSTILLFDPLLEEDKAKAEEATGRSFSERYFLYVEQIVEAIQLLMGKYKTVGLRHKGRLGGVEGSEPGWVDEIAGKRIAVRVRHYTNKNGQDQAGIDWLSPKQMKKIGIDWEIMQRDFLDEHGNPIEVDA